MKNAEYYQNKFPLENIIPTISEKEIQDIVNNCDYTIEADSITDNDHLGDQFYVNTADAAVFFEMGYQKAIDEIEKRLIPIIKL